MLKIKYDSQNPHNLTSQGGKITEDINIRTWWSSELGVLNEQGELQVLIGFHCWYTDIYNVTGMQPPQMQIDQFKNDKFRTFVTNKDTVTSNVFSIMEQFVFEFSKDYLATNYGIDPALISYLPM